MNQTTHTARPVTLAHAGSSQDMVATITPEDDDEPLILCIGQQAGAEALQRAAIRHGLELAALVAFRDGAPP